MDNNPQYFYIYHIYVDHPILLQKIVALAKYFTDNNPESKVTQTEMKNGFFTLVVSSPEAINERTANLFEEKASQVEGVIPIFSHQTNDIDAAGDHYPPTYIYSAYIALDFGFFSYYFGEGLQFRRKLTKILDSMDEAGVYKTTFYLGEMSLAFESVTAFKQSELDALFTFLKSQKISILTSYQNF